MGYKRSLESNEFDNLPFNKAMRVEGVKEVASFDEIEAPNSAAVKAVVSGEEEYEFYNIRWYDAIETEVPHAGEISSSYGEDDAGSGATSLSSLTSDGLEIDFPKKAFVPLDDPHPSLDSSPRRLVPLGQNHQATIPVWRGRVSRISGFTGTCSYESTSPGLCSIGYVDDDIEEKLMGTSVISMPDPSINSCERNEGGEGSAECNCLDHGSIRCVRQLVREARENLRKNLGNENFIGLGFSDMGEEVALKWSEEEEEVFHEVVYSNPASLGRNFWKQLSKTFPSHTKKELVSYYFNVFMLRRRAVQNRSRFLDCDSDDDECDASNADLYGFQASEEDDSAIESLYDQDHHVQNPDNSSEDDADDNSSDDGTNCNDIVTASYDMENTTDEEGGIDQRSVACKVNRQSESWCDLVQFIDGPYGVANGDFGLQDDSCMSFECQGSINASSGPADASGALQTNGFESDQSPCILGEVDLSGNMMEPDYFLEPCISNDWYPGYSGPVTDIDLLPTSSLMEEFFGKGTPDKKDKK